MRSMLALPIFSRLCKSTAMRLVCESGNHEAGLVIHVAPLHGLDAAFRPRNPSLSGTEPKSRSHMATALPPKRVTCGLGLSLAVNFKLRETRLIFVRAERARYSWAALVAVLE